MKWFTVRKRTSYCDPIAFGPCCEELTDSQTWHNKQGKQVIHQKYVRSRAVLYFLKIPVYIYKTQDIHLYWYKFWDLPPMHLPPHITKEPMQVLLRLKRAKTNESPDSPLYNQLINGNVKDV